MINLMVFVAQGLEIDVISKVESVTIYHSGALVTRTSSIILKPGMNELVFKNVSSKIILNSLKVNNKEVTILNKSNIRKLTKEELNQLWDKKDALKKLMSLIEAKFTEVGFVSKVEDLEKMTVFYSEKIQQIKKDLRDVEKKLEEAEKLKDIVLKNEHAAILKLIVSVDGRLGEPLKIQYVCGGIGWSPAYEIVVKNSADKQINIKYLAKVMSKTGEDWDDVIVNLSSSFPLESPTNLPKPSKPWVLEGNGYNAFTANNTIKQQDDKKQQIDRLDGIDYQEISIPSFLKNRLLNQTYSIKSNSTVFTFPIHTVSLPTHYYYYGFPSLDPEVYLVAQVTGWDTLGFVDGIANITYGGNDVGKSVIKFSESKDTLLLPIGKDNSVFLKRTEMADKKYFQLSTIGKKRETTLAYKYELKNNNPFPIQFELSEQVPISQTKSAEVDIEKTSNGNLNGETGEISWFLDLKPGQNEGLQLIYSIEMDGNYRYHNGQSKQRFRTISAPSF
jgi:uncharacterized protein (TIGR02231 family)